MKNISIKLMVFIVIASVNTSCKKFLELDPPKNAAVADQIFENDAIATSAITGIYSRMASSGAYSGDRSSINAMSGLSADELLSYSVSLDMFYKNELVGNSAEISALWNNSYSFIYTANTVLEGLQLKNGVSETTSRQLQGEAKFIRAFCYFYLVNLFGEVPLNLTTDYRINEKARKSSVEQIYKQITSDLADAERLLSENYVSSERIRPNKWTAKAMLSRIYLYTKKWDLAVQKSTEIINYKSLYTLVNDLDKVFLKNSSEAVWQLMPNAGLNTKEGSLFILTFTPIHVSLSPNILTAFEANDIRKTKWIKELNNTTGKYYYPFKYKITSTTATSGISEYSMVIRLAEMHLIRAEANANLARIDDALIDINIIRERAGLIVPISGFTQPQCLLEIESQRRLELFSEWGHRWLDLKRTSRATTVLEPLKVTSWNENDTLYPIPDNEIAINPNIHQNLGY